MFTARCACTLKIVIILTSAAARRAWEKSFVGFGRFLCGNGCCSIALRPVIEMSHAWNWMTVGAYNNDIILIILFSLRCTMGYCSRTAFFFSPFCEWTLNSIWITFSQPKKKNAEKRKEKSLLLKRKDFFDFERVSRWKEFFHWIVGLSRSACSIFFRRQSDGASDKRHLRKLNRRHGVSVLAVQNISLETVSSVPIHLNASKLINGFIMLKTKTSAGKKVKRDRFLHGVGGSLNGFILLDLVLLLFIEREFIAT